MDENKIDCSKMKSVEILWDDKRFITNFREAIQEKEFLGVLLEILKQRLK